MIDIGKLFDNYNRQARLYPALLTLLPLILSTAAMARHIASGSFTSGIVSIIVASGGLYLLADLARSSGKGLESGLVASWNGWPTTRFLRHSDDRVPSQTKARYASLLASKTGLVWPTAQQELDDPEAADQIYRSAISWLREQTRGPEFSLLLAENAAYGFRRNMLGLKPWAVGICTLSAALLLAHLTLQTGSLRAALPALSEPRFLPEAAALAFSALAGMGWLVLVRRPWVKAGSENYAEALLACCEKLA